MNRGALRARGLSIVLPGVPQIIAGRRAVGGTALFVWLFSLWTALSPRVDLTAALSAGWDARFALLSLAVGLMAPWAWSWRDVSGDVSGDVRGDLGGGPDTMVGSMVRSFSRNRAAVLGVMALVGVMMVGLFAPLLAPWDPNLQDLPNQFAPPFGDYLLGSDSRGRDVFTWLLHGARVSLLVGLLAAVISVTLGTVLGAVAGYAGGVMDSVIMRVVDTVMAFPRLVLLITILAFYERSVALVTVVLGLTLWPSTARLVRGEVLSLRTRDFIQAAAALGYSRRRIVLRHLIPNTLGPVIVAATLGIGHTIVLEAGLSFLGLGVPNTTPSWGVLLNAGREEMLGAWWLATFPGLAIVFTVLAFNLVGDGLRDAFDPRLRS